MGINSEATPCTGRNPARTNFVAARTTTSGTFAHLATGPARDDRSCHAWPKMAEKTVGVEPHTTGRCRTTTEANSAILAGNIGTTTGGTMAENDRLCIGRTSATGARANAEQTAATGNRRTVEQSATENTALLGGNNCALLFYTILASKAGTIATTGRKTAPFAASIQEYLILARKSTTNPRTYATKATIAPPTTWYERSR